MKRIRQLLTVLAIIVPFFIVGHQAEAAINVTGWQKYGNNPQDYQPVWDKNYLVQNNEGLSMDLRKDAILLAYIGKDFEKDILINGAEAKVGKEVGLAAGQSFTIRNMGFYNGRFLKVKVTANVAVKVLPQAQKAGKDAALVKVSTDIKNADARFQDVTIEVLDQNTDEVIEIKGNKHYMMTSLTYLAWEDYEKALLLPETAKVVIGHRTQDYSARERSLFTWDKERKLYKIGQGGAIANNTAYYIYSFLFPTDKPFMYGAQGSPGMRLSGIYLFDPITKDIAVPLGYNRLTLDEEDDGSGKVDYTLHYALPEQADASFYPQSVSVDLSETLNNDLGITTPLLKDGSNTIPATDYQIVNNKLIFPASFLKKYKGKEIQISFSSDLNYDSETAIQTYYNPDTGKFEIPLIVRAMAHFDDFDREEIVIHSNAESDFGLKLTATNLNPDVRLDKSTDDYSLDYFLKDPKSNYPNDTVTARLKGKVTFDKVGKFNIPVILTSQRLGVEQEVNMTAVVPDYIFNFEEIPKSLNFQLPTSETIAPVQADGNLIVNIDRYKGDWKLSAVTSKLVDPDSEKELIGNLYYKMSGKDIKLTPGVQTTVESGKLTNNDKESMNISSKWSEAQGLYYKAETLSNYLGKYKGKLTWVLEDAP